MTASGEPVTGGKRAFVHDASWTFASHLGNAVLQLALQILVVRVAAPERFGAYAIVQSIVALVELAVLTRGGEVALQLLGAAWHQGDPRRAALIAERIRRRDVAFAMAAWGGLALAAWPLAAHYAFPAWWLPLLACTIPVQIGYALSKSLFIVTGRLREQARFELRFAVAQALLGAVGVLAAGIPGLLVALVLAAGIKTAIAARATAGWLPRPGPEADADRAAVGAEAWGSVERHAASRNLLLAASQQLDVLLLGLWRGPETVAIYKVAKTLAQLPARGAGPIWAAIRPRLMQAWIARDAPRVRRLVAGPALTFLLLGAIGLPVMLAFAPGLLRLLYGEAYLAAAVPFVLLLGAGWLTGAATAWFPFWIAVSGAQRSGTVAALCATLALLIGGWAWGDTPERMAAVVLASGVVFAGMAWGAFWRALRRLTG